MGGKAASFRRAAGLSLPVQGPGWAHSGGELEPGSSTTFLQQKARARLWPRRVRSHTGLPQLFLGVEANILSGRAPWLPSEQRLCPPLPSAPGGCPVAGAWVLSESAHRPTSFARELGGHIKRPDYTRVLQADLQAGLEVAPRQGTLFSPDFPGYLHGQWALQS